MGADPSITHYSLSRSLSLYLTFNQHQHKMPSCILSMQIGHNKENMELEENSQKMESSSQTNLQSIL